ncbi:MAG: DUF192 domain-containing protein [Chloroflexota bacterium]
MRSWRARVSWWRCRSALGSAAIVDPTPSRASGSAAIVPPVKEVLTVGFYLRFPIDAIFADHDMRVVSTRSGMGPSRFGPIVRRAAPVIELPSGTVVATGTQVGDQLWIHM